MVSIVHHMIFSNFAKSQIMIAEWSKRSAIGKHKMSYNDKKSTAMLTDRLVTINFLARELKISRGSIQNR